jgi:hypothetical protein
MTFILNESEIDEAQAKAAHDFHRPNLQQAVLTLARLMEWTNANSDGWPHWTKPLEASRGLQNVIYVYYFGRHEDRPDRDILPSELMMMSRPIRGFLTRQGVDPAVVFVNG